MIGEPTHTTLEERMVPDLNILLQTHSSTISYVKWPLHFVFSYVQYEKCFCNQFSHYRQIQMISIANVEKPLGLS